MFCAVSRRTWLIGLALTLFACESEAPAYVAWANVCVDTDRDGFGPRCALGPDCDDADPLVHENCRPCAKPAEGCACESDTPSVDCTLPAELTQKGSLLCNVGTRFCRDGQWTACEGIRSFQAPPAGEYLGQITQALVENGGVTCDPCHPDCFRYDESFDGGTSDGGLSPGSGGGITLTSTTTESTTSEQPLLNDVECTPGVAPDFDCDGIPDEFDAYPYEPPFESNFPTIFMDLAPGESAQSSFDLRFYLNTADIYFYLDMTGSMEPERDNLIAGLTTGNFFPNGGAEVECADRDFDGFPDNYLKERGIAGNIACMIRDADFGAGWFRDIPFKGPYAGNQKIDVGYYDTEIFQNRQDITGNVDSVLAALRGFQAVKNYNTPEGGVLGMWALATGGELYAGWDRPGVPKRVGCPAGTWGYACFRDDAVPILVHITDMPMQNGPPTASGLISGGSIPEHAGGLPSHPLNYDDAVLSGMTAGTEGTFRNLMMTAEGFADAEIVGAADAALLTYTGDNTAMRADLNYAKVGACPSGSAWSATDEAAPDVVFHFKVASEKAITLSSRGTSFNSTLLLMKADASRTVLGCADNNVSRDKMSFDDADITQTLPPGEYFAVLKGYTSTARGRYQITIGDRSLETITKFAPPTWMGPAGDGVGGIREALKARGIRIITVRSSTNPELEEQAKRMAVETGATSRAGAPLTFAIDKQGTGLGTGIVDALNLLTGNLAMDVSVQLVEEPDNPSPSFLFHVEAIDQPGDSCDSPVDSDNDPQGIPDKHIACRPGAAPRFRVTFENPPEPNNVPLNPDDPNGGYHMRLELIGDGQYVVDQIPVYIIPADVVPPPIQTTYSESGTYTQDIQAGCDGTSAPVWRSLHWNATVPTDTKVDWQICTADSLEELELCPLRSAGILTSGASCTLSAECENGYCDASGVCHTVTGPSCASSVDCGTGGSCVNGACMWSQNPIDLKPALVGGMQGKKIARVRAVLHSDATRQQAPTVHDWRIDYFCTPQI